jgi:hypothetical protein
MNIFNKLTITNHHSVPTCFLNQSATAFLVVCPSPCFCHHPQVVASCSSG